MELSSAELLPPTLSIHDCATRASNGVSYFAPCRLHTLTTSSSIVPSSQRRIWDPARGIVFSRNYASLNLRNPPPKKPLSRSTAISSRIDTVSAIAALRRSKETPAAPPPTKPRIAKPAVPKTKIAPQPKMPSLVPLLLPKKIKTPSRPAKQEAGPPASRVDNNTSVPPSKDVGTGQPPRPPPLLRVTPARIQIDLSSTANLRVQEQEREEAYRDLYAAISWELNDDGEALSDDLDEVPAAILPESYRELQALFSPVAESMWNTKERIREYHQMLKRAAEVPLARANEANIAYVKRLSMKCDMVKWHFARFEMEEERFHSISHDTRELIRHRFYTRKLLSQASYDAATTRLAFVHMALNVLKDSHELTRLSDSLLHSKPRDPNQSTFELVPTNLGRKEAFKHIIKEIKVMSAAVSKITTKIYGAANRLEFRSLMEGDHLSELQCTLLRRPIVRLLATVRTLGLQIRVHRSTSKAIDEVVRRFPEVYSFPQDLSKLLVDYTRLLHQRVNMLDSSGELLPLAESIRAKGREALLEMLGDRALKFLRAQKEMVRIKEAKGEARRVLRGAEKRIARMEERKQRRVLQKNLDETQTHEAEEEAAEEVVAKVVEVAKERRWELQPQLNKASKGVHKTSRAPVSRGPSNTPSTGTERWKSGWVCLTDDCLIVNERDAPCCSRCHSSRANGRPYNSKRESTCSTCHAANKGHWTKPCQKCGHATDQAKKALQVGPSDLVAGHKTLKPPVWVCTAGSCSSINGADSDSCVRCGSSRVHGRKYKKGREWICQTCMIANRRPRSTPCRRCGVPDSAGEHSDSPPSQAPRNILPVESPPSPQEGKAVDKSLNPQLKRTMDSGGGIGLRMSGTRSLRSPCRHWHNERVKDWEMSREAEVNVLGGALSEADGPETSSTNNTNHQANDAPQDSESNNTPDKAPSQGNSNAKGMFGSEPPSDGEDDKRDKDTQEEVTEDEEEAQEEQQEEHIPLSFQIPPDVLRTAMTASLSTGAAYWRQELYRGPDNTRILLHYCKTLEVAETVARYFTTKKILGFDTEWKPNVGASAGIKGNISLIQLACEDRIALFHIAAFEGETLAELLPPTVKQIMENPEITKVGVGIRGDCTRLRKWLGVEPRGLFELSHLYKVVKFSATEPRKVNKVLVSLATQVQELLQLPLAKGGVRESDWSRVLSYEQVMYAATDAYAGFRVYDALEAKRKQMRPTPACPSHAELNLPLLSKEAKAGKAAAAVAEGVAEESEGYETALEEQEAVEEETDSLSEESSESSDEADLDSEAEYIPSTKRVGRVRLARDTAPELSTFAAVEASDDDSSNASSADLAEQVHDLRISSPDPAQQRTTDEASTSTSIPPLLTAETWTRTYLSNAPSPPSSSSKPQKPRASTAHLRAYSLWHHQKMSINEIAKLLRDPPLSYTTVASYIAGAVMTEDLPFEKERVGDVVREVKKLPLGARARFEGWTRWVEGG